MDGSSKLANTTAPFIYEKRINKPFMILSFRLGQEWREQLSYVKIVV